MPNPDDITPPDIRSTWARILDKITPLLIGLLIALVTLATAWINSKIDSLKHGQEKAVVAAEKAVDKADQVQKTTEVAAKASADANVAAQKVVANLEGNTPAAQAKVAEAVRTVEAVKAATQETK